MRTPQVVFGNDFANVFMFKGRREQGELRGFVSQGDMKYPDESWQEMRLIGKQSGGQENGVWFELARIGCDLPPLPNVLGHVPPEEIKVRPLTDSAY